MDVAHTYLIANYVCMEEFYLVDFLIIPDIQDIKICNLIMTFKGFICNFFLCQLSDKIHDFQT